MPKLLGAQLIYGVLKQRERVMVLLDFGTGLRRRELSGVRWEEICFEDKVLTPKALNRETAYR